MALVFLSYASEYTFDRPPDDNQEITVFWSDLAAGIRDNLKAEDCPGIDLNKDSDIVFLDYKCLSEGEIWQSVVENALNDACVFVPLYKPAYFSRYRFASREWQFYRERQGDSSSSTRICPLLWGTPEHTMSSIPAEIGDLHGLRVETLRESSEIYVKSGLKHLVRLRETNGAGEYQNLILKLSSRFARLIKAKSDLIKNEGSLDRIKPLSFGDEPAAPEVDKEDHGAANTRRVRVVPVAGKRDEVKEAIDKERSGRPIVGAYGKESIDWKPFFPDGKQVAEIVAPILLDAGNRVPLFSQHFNKLVEEGKVFHEESNFVIVLVDPWTLVLLDQYADAIRDWASARLPDLTQVAVIVQEEDKPRLNEFRKKVKQVFGNFRQAYQFVDVCRLDEFSNYLKDWIVSLENLHCQFEGGSDSEDSLDKIPSPIG